LTPLSLGTLKNTENIPSHQNLAKITYSCEDLLQHSRY